MASTSRVRILIADDYVLVAEALCKLLSHDFKIVALVHDGRKLIEADTKLLPDIILADVNMPVLNGLHDAERIKRQLPNIKILCITVTTEPEVIEEALNLGLDGYMNQDVRSHRVAERYSICFERETVPFERAPLAERFCNTRTRSANRAYRELTDRPLDIVQLVAEGCSMKEAARVLNLTTRNRGVPQISCHEATQSSE